MQKRLILKSIMFLKSTVTITLVMYELGRRGQNLRDEVNEQWTGGNRALVICVWVPELQ
jgi:hypothetical protein